MIDSIRIIKKFVGGLWIPVQMNELEKWDCFVVTNPDGSTFPLPTQPISLVVLSKPEMVAGWYAVECTPQIIYELAQAHFWIPSIRILISEHVTCPLIGAAPKPW